MTYDRIAHAVHGAIGHEIRNQLARVTGTLLPNGTIPCYAEALGNVLVICRTTEDIVPGTWIYIYKSSTEKYAPWMYAGFAASTERTTRPRISSETVINVPPVNDTGSGTGAAGSLQASLDGYAHQLRVFKGTESWDSPVDTSLSRLVTWREPVSTPLELPVTGNRIGDVRYVVLSNMLFVWTSSGWRSPGFDSTQVTAQNIALMSVGVVSIPSFQLVAYTATGIVPASASILGHAGMIAGITLESGGSGQQILVQVSGSILFPTACFLPGWGQALVGVGGTISMTLHVGAMFAQHVGIVVRSNELILQLSGTTVLLDTPYVGNEPGMATTIQPGIVLFAEHNESAAGEAVQADDPRLGSSTVSGNTFYRFTQVTPSADWYIVHNLGYRPNVEVVDTAGTEIIGSLDHLDTNTLRITFSVTVSGVADCS